MNETESEQKKRALAVSRRLKKIFPDAGCTLTHHDPFQLLIATILSAQCTDKRVNQVTPELFRRFPKGADFVRAGISEVEEAIKSTGFYHNKAKNIIALCGILDARYGGEVPQTLEELVALPGVGRKTANVVLGNAFGIVSGFVVDTHVGRLARRLGLTDSDDPVKVEKDLCCLYPRKEWIDLSHRLIQLGRSACNARKPDCGNCPLAELCPSNKESSSKESSSKESSSKNNTSNSE